MSESSLPKNHVAGFGKRKPPYGYFRCVGDRGAIAPKREMPRIEPKRHTQQAISVHNSYMNDGFKLDWHSHQGR